MITYTETAFNMEARKVDPVARWAAEDFPAALLLKVLRWAFFDCKPAKIKTN